MNPDHRSHVHDDDYTDRLGTSIQFPHCDSLILHSRATCEFCDRHPDWQALRSAMGVAFSNDTLQTIAEHNLVPCPSTYRRSAEVRDRWGGNAPQAMVYRAGGDGWEPAIPLEPVGLVTLLELRCRLRGWTRLANLLAAWDERKLGR